MAGADGDLSEARRAELTALADGSLAPAKRAEVEAAVERSPHLRALLDQQRAAVAALRALDAPVPASLRARVEAARRPADRPRRLGFALAAGLAFAVAAAILVLTVISPGGEAAAPTVFEVAALAARGPRAPAPERDHRQPRLLAASVAGASFPNYDEVLGWRAFGRRTDELAGRATQTVFYERRGRPIAYTISTGPALEWPAAARRTVRHGVSLRVVKRGPQTIVAWLRESHPCVLSGVGVPREQLLRLAAWTGAKTGRS